jgi:hypothetical protein
MSSMSETKAAKGSMSFGNVGGSQILLIKSLYPPPPMILHYVVVLQVSC